MISSAKPTLRLTITAVLGVMIVATAMIITWFSYTNSRASLLDTSRTLLQQVSQRISVKTLDYLKPMADATRICNQMVDNGVMNIRDMASIEATYFSFMKSKPQFASLDFGDRNGNFLMVKRLSDGTLATKTVRRDSSNQVVSIWKYREPGAGLFQIRETRHQEGDTYDPRLRPWYTGAAAIHEVYWTDVYIFATDKKPAITAAYAIRDTAGTEVGVTSVSITLDDLSTFLSEIKVSAHSKVFIMDSRGRVVGFPGLENMLVGGGDKLSLPILAASKQPELEAVSRTPEFNNALFSGSGAEMFRFTLEDEPYLGTLTPLAYQVGEGWTIGAIVPEDDFIGSAKEAAAKTTLISLVVG